MVAFVLEGKVWQPRREATALLLAMVRKKTDECSTLLVFCAFEDGPSAHGMILRTSRVGLPSST